MLGMVVLRIRHKREVRRRYLQNVLRNRHLAWVARQEAADRRRDAEAARREQQQREQQRVAVQHQAREIASQIGDGLARIQRRHETPPRRPVSAVSETASVSAETKKENQAIPPRRGAETARATERGNAGRSEDDSELRRGVYALIEVDRDGWRRWRGPVDAKQYPRFWRGRKQGGWTQAYRLIYLWELGPIPKHWTIDHACGEKDCLDHLECVTRGENLRRRHARERGELRTGHAGLVPPRRAA